MDDSKVSQSLFGPRVRLAPSPTGWFHIGNARTGLFNFLFARKNGGKFILRVEDTDKERSEKKYEQNLLAGLKWLGIEWDEGPEVNGPFGPYNQSQRIEIYKKYLEQLLKEEKAYYCFCTPEELEAQRTNMIAQGLPPIYSEKCRDLSREEVEKNLIDKKSAVIRIKMPNKIVKFTDLIRGEVEFDLSLIGDTVIAKSLEEPLYNFAVVIDDYLMKITHVIRGEDHISNTPKQITIHELLGLPVPIYAHLPMILGPDRSKLSSRHGATSLIDYQKMGYLPEALLNFLAFLGWHPLGDREIYNLEELIGLFNLDRVQKGGAVFDIKRLDWFNSQHLKQLSTDQLFNKIGDYFKEFHSNSDIFQKYSSEYIKKIIELEAPRLTKLSEFLEFSEFFFQEILNYPKEYLQWKEMYNEEIVNSLNNSLEILEKIKEKEFNRINIQIKFYNFISEHTEYEKDKGRMLWPLRVALSGKKASPGPFEIIEILGKDKSIERVKQAIQLITN